MSVRHIVSISTHIFPLFILLSYAVTHPAVPDQCLVALVECVFSDHVYVIHVCICLSQKDVITSVPYHLSMNQT